MTIDDLFDVENFRSNHESVIRDFKNDLLNLRRPISIIMEKILQTPVPYPDGEPCSVYATVAKRGPRMLSIGVYNARDMDKITSSIQAALGLTPQKAKNVPQQLLVELPPLTKEDKQRKLKQYNEAFEQRRNGAHNSLASIRDKALKPLKGLKGVSKDDIKATQDKIERIHKAYTQELRDELDKAKAATA
ncbi:hypothetical protein CANCADRAFT_42983 [Tortispora caseinolytica NRRL Y-17796]|uniref:Ribosome-recycling factor, mitochondrial n=1 Tax=Tortispora caseinolytica NRRL Y-17796 TaxID=767744 RepID=A0A1E4TKX9_9ASCO|nr:hypothetical protein CANCADRAFT_42983 [Tortispora caseinolytica NRRL Y-17796]